MLRRSSSTRAAGAPGAGGKGPRVYDWVRLPLARSESPDQGHWLLARRSLADPTDLAYSLVFAPPATALAALVRVAGARWAIEERIAIAPGEVGLADYEVRRRDGWYRHIALALAAQAFLKRRLAAAGPQVQL